jgi:3-dehydroquinate synthase
MIEKISVNIPAQLKKDYSILIGAKLNHLPKLFSLKNFSKIVIVTDHIVKKHYATQLNIQLKKMGHQSILISFPPGEKFKNAITKEKIENKMLANHCDRNTLIVALGGGVVGDIAGFVAATFLRGIAYVQIPTTLLAMIDSSIGGKTGINTTQGKNLIGAIYQPKCVMMDINTLKTLSKTAKINGIVEALKIFLTHDAKSFRYTQLHLKKILNGDPLFLKNMIKRAVKIKADVVFRDEKENGERSLLNFGHTIGHALEKVSQYQLLHGYAVAYGILIEATLSYLLGLLDVKELLYIQYIFSELGINGKDLKKYPLKKILSAIKYDKKIKNNKPHYILLEKMGYAYISKGQYTHSISDKMIQQAFQYVFEEV